MDKLLEGPKDAGVLITHDLNKEEIKLEIWCFSPWTRYHSDGYLRTYCYKNCASFFVLYFRGIAHSEVIRECTCGNHRLKFADVQSLCLGHLFGFGCFNLEKNIKEMLKK